METYSWLELVENYVFYYPLAMSIVWMIGASYFYLRRERGEKQVPELKEYPLVSVLIPARNEEDAIRSTIEAVLSSQYPNFEIIVLDDASTDSTAAIVQEIEANEERVRVLLLNENVGKPSALRYGALASSCL